jgi:hypothetical protein
MLEQALEDFRKQNPRAIMHIRRTQKYEDESTPTLHSWIYSNTSMSQDALCAALPYAQCESPVPTTATTVTTRPLIDQFGMVLPRTPPSPTPPPTLLFNSRVETPASWPPSDDMGIETHTPIYVPSRSPSPGTTSWAPITVPSRSPSPFWPGGPRPTPEKGVDAIPVASMGSNPGSPIPGTPEYNYDLTFVMFALHRPVGVSHELELSCDYDIISSGHFYHLPYDVYVMSVLLIPTTETISISGVIASYMTHPSIMTQ